MNFVSGDNKIRLSQKCTNINGTPIVLTIIKTNELTEVTFKYPTQNYLICNHNITLLVLCVLGYLIFYNASVTRFIVSVLITLFYAYKIMFRVTQEKLLVIKSLGYQIESTYSFGTTRTYIPWQDIKSIFINEVISKQRVLFLLTILTNKCEKLTPIFIETLPRLQYLEIIYQNLETYQKLLS